MATDTTDLTHEILKRMQADLADLRREVHANQQNFVDVARVVQRLDARLSDVKADLETMRGRLAGLIKGGASRADVVKILEDDYGWRSTGCPPSPPTAGCLQYQQVDALIAELKR